MVDIADAAALDRVVDAARPGCRLPPRAQSSVTVSVADPAHDCTVNVLGTLNVLEAAGRHGAPVTFTSTGGALYGNHAPIPTSEEQPPAPLAPYGASKWAGEAYVRTWAACPGHRRMPCAGWATSTDRARVLTARRAWSRSSATTLWRGDPPTVFGDGTPDARLRARRRRRHGAHRRQRQRRRLQRRHRASRPTSLTVLRRRCRTKPARRRAAAGAAALRASSSAAAWIRRGPACSLGWQAQVELHRGLRRDLSRAGASSSSRAPD